MPEDARATNRQTETDADADADAHAHARARTHTHTHTQTHTYTAGNRSGDRAQGDSCAVLIYAAQEEGDSCTGLLC